MLGVFFHHVAAFFCAIYRPFGFVKRDTETESGAQCRCDVRRTECGIRLIPKVFSCFVSPSGREIFVHVLRLGAFLRASKNGGPGGTSRGAPYGRGIRLVQSKQSPTEENGMKKAKKSFKLTLKWHA